MLAVLAWAVVVASGSLAAWALLTAVRDRRVSGPLLAGLAALELALVVQALLGAVAVARGAVPVDTVTFVGYLVASVVLVPSGALWGIADRSRWGGGVVAIACVAVGVVALRLLQLGAAG